MGIGMTMVVAPQKVRTVLQFIRTQKHKAWVIGEVVKGRGSVRVL
jgi:phosphoribosylaminoimidazole (AIR) synthetase